MTVDGHGLLDVAELRRLGSAIERRERERSALHAEQCADALALQRAYDAAGSGLGASTELALLLACSTERAEALLAEAATLARLDVLPALRAGRLTVEQARVVAEVLGGLAPALAGPLWRRLAVKLDAEAEAGVVRPPARLRALLSRWVIAADPDGAAERRRVAQRAAADVRLFARGDGLVDLLAAGLDPVSASACLSRVERFAARCGAAGDGTDDQRTAGERRRDALVALLTGAPLGGERPAGEVPEGVQVHVHVPLTSALAAARPAVAQPCAGGAGEAAPRPAELVGHGPIDPALLAAVLAARPVLRRVWVDPATGVPVAADPSWCRPEPSTVVAALTDLAEPGSGAPPICHPVHPQGHPGAHEGPPGGYRPTRAQRRLAGLRAPCCEWPGCGRRASPPGSSPCDLDHDRPWPHGPTCACNLGPLCRRHHRVKQLGWTKQRRPDGSVAFTSPTGRTWVSPVQAVGVGE